MFAGMSRPGHRMFLTLAATAALAGCGGDDRTAGGVTANEARALDDAAEMLEQGRLPDGLATAPAAPDAEPPPLPPAAGPRK